MTIGIAASGPGAARAILDALAKAELVAGGAIGGFVSLACLHPGGIARRDTQRGGARAILADDLPPDIVGSGLAVLMSSGPDRPAPLSQFTPAEAGTGLVTGHRFPNTPGPDGLSLAETVLDRMRHMPPDAAADTVAADHPAADAGFLCIDLKGRIGMANTAYVAGFPGLGRAIRGTGDARVAVLCNGISPSASLADLVADLALDAMTPRRTAGAVTLAHGLPVRGGDRAELRVDATMSPVELILPGFRNTLEWNGGYGPAALLTCGGRIIGRLADEPYLTGRENRVEGYDGKATLTVAYVTPDAAGSPARTLAPDRSRRATGDTSQA